MVVRDFLAGAGYVHIDAMSQRDTFLKEPGSQRMFPSGLMMPQDLNDDRWENHALLGHRVVELIKAARDKFERVAEFDQELEAGKVKTDSHFRNGALRAVTVEDGSATFEYVPAPIHYSAA